MIEKLNHLVKRAHEIKESPSIEHDFHEFLKDLRTLKDESIEDFTTEKIHDPELIHQISSLIAYKPYDQLNILNRIVIQYFIAKIYNWSEHGRFLYDLDNIELRLNAILFKLRNNLPSV